MIRQSGREENALMKLLHQVASDVGMSEHSYVVGGAVRDVAMGLDPKDVDVVVETREGRNAVDLSKALAERLGIDPKHIIADQYGVVHVGPVPHDFYFDSVNLKGQKIEIVTARKEKYERGKGKDFKPTSVEPGSIIEDLQRRDTTFNTLVFRLHDLAQGPDKSLILDLLGQGIKDLDDRILRTPIDPNDTFSEDPTRMLRAVRMIVKYDMKFDPQTARALRNQASEIVRVPGEKLNEELTKLLEGKNPKFALKLMDAMGLLKYVLPELKALRKQKSEVSDDVFTHVMDAVNVVDADLIKRLTLLFSGMDHEAVREIVQKDVDFYSDLGIEPQIAEKVLKRLRYPNKVTSLVVKLLESKGAIKKDISDKELRRLQYELGEHLEYLLDIVHALNITRAEGVVEPDLVPELQRRLFRMNESEGSVLIDKLKNPPLGGNDIMTLLGMSRGGKQVGDAMRIQQEMILTNPFVTSSEIQRAILGANLS